MFEDLVFAVKMFKRSKTRTVLSLLGVIIGVASVIIIGTIGDSAANNIKKTFGSANLNMIQVNSGYMRRASRENRIELNEAWRKEIFGLYKGIRKIWFKNNLSATLMYGDLSYSVNANAVEYSFLETCGLKLGEGRYFNVSDSVEGTQTVILGKEPANALFPNGGALENSITLQNDGVNFGFKVIGILTGQAAGWESPDTGVYIPRGFYTKKIAPVLTASQAIIEAESPSKVTQITEELRSYAEQKTGDSFALNVSSMQAMLEQFDEVTGTISLLLSGIAAISLLVGGIGIMNIMIVTVTERKKEIGIRKAIGASPAVIRAQFLTEAAAITIVGGALGILTGLGISAIVVFFLKWSFVMPWLTCAAAFGFSAFVGVFFGFYPASRAAKLDPVLALAAE
ncbi:MAG: ABC transporter permease [Spirochaetaceae bacterium]|nr:ABC transporter permease [Spirochaetaceae bacterium]